MLTSKKVEAARGETKQYKLYDAQGLYLVVTPRNVKSWRCNYKSEGKNKTKVFGQFPAVSLASARLMNAEFKDLLAQGALTPVRTFDHVKEQWYIHHLPTLKNAKHRKSVPYRLDTFASPKIGSMELSTIKRADLVALVQGVQNREDGKTVTVETAHRVGTYIRQVLDYAVDLGYIEYHPAAGLSRVLKSKVSTSMPCIAISEAPAFFNAIMALKDPLAKHGLLLLCLTFVRTTELRFMTYDEIRDGTFWVIPKERMKKNREHVVPLSGLALESIAALRSVGDGSAFVLRSPQTIAAPVNENFFLSILKRMGYGGVMTGHGFRALASTVLNELSPFEKDVIERQLAHDEKNATRAAYNRAEYLSERIKLMSWYSDWVSTQIESGAEGEGSALKLEASRTPTRAPALTKAQTRA